MRSITTILILLTLLPSAFAQGSKEYEVSAGQLKTLPPRSTAKQSSTQTKNISGRTQHEIHTMVQEIAAGYRSMCCQHKSLLGADSCQSYDQQIAMIEFLVEQGFNRDQVDEYMVNGGPANLEGEYIEWVKARRRANNQDDSAPIVNTYLVMPPSGDKEFMGLGYRRGWGEALHEAPRNVWLYFVIGAGAVAIFMAYSIAASSLRRKREQEGQQPETREDNELDQRIRRDMAQLEDE